MSEWCERGGKVRVAGSLQEGRASAVFQRLTGEAAQQPSGREEPACGVQCKGPEAGLGGGGENGTPCLDLGTGTQVPSAISSAPLGAVLSVYESEGGNRSSSVSLEQRKLRTEETPTHQPLAREGESETTAHRLQQPSALSGAGGGQGARSGHPQGRGPRAAKERSGGEGWD